MATTLPPDEVPLSRPAPPVTGGPGDPLTAPVPPVPEGPRDPRELQRLRQRAVWTAGVLVLLLLVGLAAWFVQGITVDQRLQAVGKATVLGAPVAPAPAPQPPAEPAAASLAADETLVDPAGLATAAVATTALTAAGGQGAAQSDAKADGDEPVRKVRKVRKAGKKQASRRQAAARAARDRTFIRCPPLGREGAVMCRWHVCNGAAGKEAACRPYLERKP